MQKVQEAFEIASLRPVDRVYDKSVYSSDEIKDLFLSTIKKQGLLSSILPSIENLMEREIIVPCFASSGLVSLIAYKMFANKVDKMTYAFYHRDNNKIYIFMDNQTKFIFWINNKLLSALVAHELMHYAARNNPNEFIKFFEDDLITYFRRFFYIYGQADVSEDNCKHIVKWIFNSFEKNQAKFDTISEYAKMLDGQLKDSIPMTSDRDLFTKTMLTRILIFLRNSESFVYLAKSDPETSKLVRSLLESYKSFGIGTPSTMAIQELVFPSEVIAILSEKPHAKHLEVIRSI